MVIIMAKVKQTIKKTTKSKYRKSQTKGKGKHKRCGGCGRFL